MAGKFRKQANELIDELEGCAAANAWRVKSSTIGETEGGAGTVKATFVLALDGDDALAGTPMGSAVGNGATRTPEQEEAFREAHQHQAREVARVDGEDPAFGGFAAPRAHRPGAEAKA